MVHRFLSKVFFKSGFREIELETYHELIWTQRFEIVSSEVGLQW